MRLNISMNDSMSVAIECRIQKLMHETLDEAKNVFLFSQKCRIVHFYRASIHRSIFVQITFEIFLHIIEQKPASFIGDKYIAKSDRFYKKKTTIYFFLVFRE